MGLTLGGGMRFLPCHHTGEKQAAERPASGGQTDGMEHGNVRESQNPEYENRCCAADEQSEVGPRSLGLCLIRSIEKQGIIETQPDYKQKGRNMKQRERFPYCPQNCGYYNQRTNDGGYDTPRR